MKSAVIRGIWGDRNQGHGDKDIFKSAKRIVENKEPCDFIYVYGKDNAKELEQIGLKVVLLHSDPNNYPEEFRKTPYRWGNKLRIIREALTSFDEVVWMDLDVHQVNPMPIDFWEKLRKGPMLKAALEIRIRSSFSAVWRLPKFNMTQSKAVLNQSMSYYKKESLPFIDCALGYMNEEKCDQRAVTRAFDQWQGDWIGAKSFIEQDYLLSGFYIHTGVFIPPKEEIYFAVYDTTKKDWYEKNPPAYTKEREILLQSIKEDNF